jgi:hypothetical protein
MIMTGALVNIVWACVFIIVSASIGIILILVSSMIIPKLVDRLTPNIDEDKEIATGNRAVAEYFGRISAAGIIGISIIISAAIISGMLFVLF